jgi:hypothetical protein
MTRADRLHDSTERVIRASDLASYAFCAHAWWLGSVEGQRSENVQALEMGSASHARHGLLVAVSNLLMRLSILLLLLAGLVGLGWLISLLTG